MQRDVVQSSLLAAAVMLGIGCGDNNTADPCDFAGFESGGNGHSEPLGAAPGQARAGRIGVGELPPTTLGMEVWQPGDFVLANDRVAIVIEDSGPSDLYDPWGGRPVGVASVENGALVRPADFGEFFLLTARFTVVTQQVSVVADGSDGGPAIVRASGPMAPLPFFEAITGAILRDPLDGVIGAIDYVLEPNAEHVDIRYHYFSPRPNGNVVNVIMHGFMYGDRMPVFAPNTGFGASASLAPYLGFIDEDATSYSYENPGEDLGPGIAESGFSSNLTDGFDIPGCEVMTRDHARMIIGGPGLDGLNQAIARTRGETLRAITGVTRDAAGLPAAGVRVHAETADGDYISRALSDEDGNYAIHVGEGVAPNLIAFRRGDALTAPVSVPTSQSSVDLSLSPAGLVHVVTLDSAANQPLPARIQILPTGAAVESPPRSFGERQVVGGRLDVVFPPDGEATLRVPVGDWEVIVSRGYEYELHREQITVVEDATVEVAAVLDRVVDTTGVMCADYHIHTIRSADGRRTGAEMAASAIADGLDIPVRSDHEFINDFEPDIAALGLEEWAFGLASVEMTSMEIWGHMGVLPLTPDESAINNGTPRWQRFPTAANPDIELELLNPREVFDNVRAREEGSRLIINHPTGSTNYFGYSGLDLDTASPGNPDVWDEEFAVIEAFNGSSFVQNRERSVKAWFSLLNSGRTMFAVGSSDAHGLDGRGTAYPRTCLRLGTDDPRTLTPRLVADATVAGRSSVVGGIYVGTSVGAAGPGETVAGGDTAVLDFDIQAASWVDVDRIEIIVDGVTIETIDVTPQDADPGNPTIRFAAQRSIDVAAAGSWVVVAAYGDSDLSPVTDGELPFGVTNPIFLTR